MVHVSLYSSKTRRTAMFFNGTDSSDCYGSPFPPRKRKKMQVTTHYFEIVSRYFEIVSRYFEIVSRYFDIVSRYFDIVSRYFDIVSRYFEILSHYNEITSSPFLRFHRETWYLVPEVVAFSSTASL